jgi:hypothetical protein
VKYREFVDYVKNEIAEAIEHRDVDPMTHFFMLNGDGDEGATLVVQNEAILNPGARVIVWRGALVPLIERRKFQRIALITVGPVQTEDGEIEDHMSAGLTIADGERMEGWLAPIYDEGESSPYLGEWDGPHLDSDIPSWEIIEGALR